MTAAARFDAIYRGRFRTGSRDWSASDTVREVMDYFDLLCKHADVGGTDLLELGCGTGTLSFPLASRGFQVTALDISPVAIAQARRRARRAGERVTFRVHDIRRPLSAFADQFDLAVDSLVLHYVTAVADRLAAMRFAADCVRPGGAVLIMTMCGVPRWIPPGSWFDPQTRLLMTGDMAECYYGEPATLASQFRVAGLRSDYAAVVPGNDQTMDQDMYLAVLR
jgi:SAM-dependent methyltransferase